MKKLILGTCLLALVSCANTGSNSRKIASTAKELTGTFLGVADYGKGHKSFNKRAMRIYFAPIEGEADKYNVVILEYVDLLKMAPSYITSNKIPFIAKKTGYLKNITSNISAYEANPGQQEGTFELWPLVVQGDQIVPNKASKPRILTLSNTGAEKNVLEGATISSVNADEPKEIFFPMKDDEKRNGIQYGTAKAAYKVAKLESTWRKNYLSGPYLSQYYKKDDVVLKCSQVNQKPMAEFIVNEKMSSMPEKKRAKMFTNPKSAFLAGEYAVSEPRDGMFLFHPVRSDDASKEIIQGKVGLFIDIFDATKSLNQDVVELALINPESPEDFLMYYEHPDNGEGKDHGPR